MVSKNELKYIKSLKLKKYRRSEGAFVVEGLKNVEELLDSSYEVKMLLCTANFIDRFKDYNPKLVNADQLKAIGTLTVNDSCLAVVKLPVKYEPINHNKNVIVLDGVSDPGNLGTIIRSLDWFGFDQLVCSPDCADFFNSKTISATMGAFTRIIPTYKELPAFLREYDGNIFAMDIDGDSLEEYRPSAPAAYVMGSESHGISDEIMKMVTNQLTIKKHGHAESLNVAMATSILLYHLRLF